MPEKPLFCLGEAWVELGADTVPELAETFRVSVGGWGAAFCRAYVRAGGHAALLSQLGADPFGRKAAAQLAADGIDCTHLCFTDAARTPVVFSGAGKLLPYRAPSAELLYAPEQLDAAALRGAFALCFSSGCLLDSPARLTHLKAIAAARDAGAFVCYAPRMAEAAPCWPEAAALREQTPRSAMIFCTRSFKIKPSFVSVHFTHSAHGSAADRLTRPSLSAASAVRSSAAASMVVPYCHVTAPTTAPCGSGAYSKRGSQTVCVSAFCSAAVSQTSGLSAASGMPGFASPANGSAGSVV